MNPETKVDSFVGHNLLPPDFEIGNGVCDFERKKRGIVGRK